MKHEKSKYFKQTVLLIVTGLLLLSNWWLTAEAWDDEWRQWEYLRRLEEEQRRRRQQEEERRRRMQEEPPVLIITVPGLNSNGENLMKLATRIEPRAKVVDDYKPGWDPQNRHPILNVDMDVGTMDFWLKGDSQSDWANRQVAEAVKSFRDAFGEDSRVIMIDYSYGNTVGRKVLLPDDDLDRVRIDGVFAFSPGAMRDTLNKMGEHTRLFTVTCEGDFHGPVHINDGPVNFETIVIESLEDGAKVSRPHNDMVAPKETSRRYRLEIGGETAVRSLEDVIGSHFNRLYIGIMIDSEEIKNITAILRTAAPAMSGAFWAWFGEVKKLTKAETSKKKGRLLWALLKEVQKMKYFSSIRCLNHDLSIVIKSAFQGKMCFVPALIGLAASFFNAGATADDWNACLAYQQPSEIRRIVLSLSRLQKALESGEMKLDQPLPITRLKGIIMDGIDDVYLIGSEQQGDGVVPILPDDIAVAMQSMLCMDSAHRVPNMTEN